MTFIIIRNNVTCLCAVFGNVWAAINPWSGLVRLIGIPAPLRLPDRIGYAPALIGLIAFGSTLFNSLAAVIGSQLYDIRLGDFYTVIKDYDNPAGVAGMKLTQGLTAFGLFIFG